MIQALFHYLITQKKGDTLDETKTSATLERHKILHIVIPIVVVIVAVVGGAVRGSMR